MFVRSASSGITKGCCAHDRQFAEMYHLQANTRRYRDLDLQRRNGVEGLVRFYIQSCNGKLVPSNCMMLKQFPILNSDIVESPCLFLLLLLFFDFFLFSSLFRQIVYKYVTCRTELIINVHTCIWSTEQKGWEIQLGFRYTLCRLRTETVLHRKKDRNYCWYNVVTLFPSD